METCDLHGYSILLGNLVYFAVGTEIKLGTVTEVEGPEVVISYRDHTTLFYRYTRRRASSVIIA